MTENSDTFEIMICLSFYITGGEVIPRNQAIRIWKRVGCNFFSFLKTRDLKIIISLKNFLKFLCHK